MIAATRIWSQGVTPHLVRLLAVGEDFALGKPIGINGNWRRQRFDLLLKRNEPLFDRHQSKLPSS